MPAFRAPPSRAFSQLGETGAIGIDPTAIFRVDSDNEANATIRIGPFVLLLLRNLGVGGGCGSGVGDKGESEAVGEIS